MSQKFITKEIRESAGQFQPVSDIVMQNIGKERMGNCEACGHPIELHCGVYHQAVGYLYVGKDCKQTLCARDAQTITPESGTAYTDEHGNERVIVGNDVIESLKNLLFKEVGGSIYKTRHCNVFTESIYYQMTEGKKYSGYATLSAKQYAAIMRNL